MSFVPYLHFNGTCAEAMAFYAEVFGARDLQMTRYRDAPEAVPDWPDSDRIIHARFSIDGFALMASDFPPGQDEAQQAVSVMTTAADAAAGVALYDRLVVGGDRIIPWGKTFFAEGFGMCKDRFGTHWMVRVQAGK